MSERRRSLRSGGRPCRRVDWAFRVFLAAIAIMTVLADLPGAAAVPFGQEEEDLDAFMEQVLRRRITNWEDLYKYTLRDRESFEVKGPGGVALESHEGEYIWYVRDGFMVRSPHTINGAKVSDKEREKQELEFLDRMKEREERREKRKAEIAGEIEEAREDAEAVEDKEEGAIEREYFLGFPFEPGNYLVAGRERFEGMDLVKIEYYPQKLFEDDDSEEEPDEEDLKWQRWFAKTSLVTLWVLVQEHQIVKIRYDNLGFDFLPLRWLFQVGDIGAEMVMHKPFDDLDVWLPREISAYGDAAVATGKYEFTYSLMYYDYKETDVGAKVRFRLPPGIERQNQDR